MVGSLAGPEVGNHPVVVVPDLVGPTSPKVVSIMSYVIVAYYLNTHIHMLVSAVPEPGFRMRPVGVVAGIVALHRQLGRIRAVAHKLVAVVHMFAQVDRIAAAVVAHIVVAAVGRIVVAEVDHIVVAEVDHTVVAEVDRKDFAHKEAVMWAMRRDSVVGMKVHLHGV